MKKKRIIVKEIREKEISLEKLNFPITNQQLSGFPNGTF